MYTYQRNFSEKRRFIRMKMDCPILFHELDSEQVLTGTCVDLSASGILVQCDQFYPLGTKLRIEVMPRLSLSPSLTAVVEVKRITPVVQTRSYRFAGVIEYIDS